MTQDLKCPKCQSEMVQGFILDHGQDYRKYASSWLEGQPKRSWLTGIKAPRTGIPIAAFRCKGCGYLEFYADEKFAAQ